MSREKMMTTADDWFLNCIACVKRAPGMWVPTESARALDLFLLGYMKARDDLGLPEYGANESGLREQFQAWLCAKLHLHTRVGWVYCVEQLDGKPHNIGTFVSLFEEFLETKGRALPEANLEQWAGVDLKGEAGMGSSKHESTQEQDLAPPGRAEDVDAPLPSTSEAHHEAPSRDVLPSLGGGPMNLALFFEDVGRRPGNYLHDWKFDTAVGFVDGFNVAHDGAALLGFNEWLVLKLGYGSKLGWSTLVRRLLAEADEEGASSPDDPDAQLVQGLFALVVEFLKERSSRNGLRTIFLRHEE